MKRNAHLSQLSPNYLFLEVQKRKKEFIQANPTAKILSFSIGDTTEPLAPSVSNALIHASTQLSTREGYSGYGSEEGTKELRHKIAETFYPSRISADEIFISDGAKCDIGRLQLLFGNQITVGLQDPAYPVYVDGSLLQGIQKIVRLPCTKENNFFPNLNIPEKLDLIYFCSPNNPTGSVATREQLSQLIAFTKQNKALLIFDVAYASYIQDPHLPKSIYEIEGAKSCAIEVGSFSKMAGFSGIRLGWCVVPNELTYECGRKVKDDFTRLITTIFNGASILSQKAGLAALTHYHELESQIAHYLHNAHLLKQALHNYTVHGGTHSPYLWLSKENMTSAELFSHFLEEHHIITTPGIGFGPSGEGYIRLSAFGSRQTIEEAIDRLQRSYAMK